MKELDFKTKTYSVKREYLIDVVETDDYYEGYIYTKDSTIKMFMIGCPSETVTEAEFRDMLEDDLAVFVSEYEAMLCEDEDD